MKNKDEEYKEIFLAEAIENFEEINRLLTVLERSKNDAGTLHALFRITHTLKGNAAGMGFTAIAEMAHVLEDLFGEIRDARIGLDDNVVSSLYKGVDVLGLLVHAVQDGTEVPYKGIRTKLEVIIKRAAEGGSSKAPAPENLSPFAPEPADGTPDEVVPDVPGEADTKIAFSDLVQVPVRKLDNLLNLVGELIIEKDRILATQSGTGLHASNEYARLSRISSDLQYSVMDVRLVQVGFLFNKFHRVVRDAASSEQKDVILKLEGTDTEIDRNVLQVISDSLIHIIRNAVGHGIESRAEREALGKPKEGTVRLSARSETDAVIIEIRDDGKGLDYEKIKSKAITKGLITEDEASRLTDDELGLLIFEPGFSTVDQVTSISGRGVGMDVVKKTLDSIGGEVSITTEPGAGTTLQLKLPSSMAVKSSLLFELKDEVYAIPLSYTQSVISLYRSDVHKAGGGLVASHLGKNITVVFLKDVFEHQHQAAGSSNNPLHQTYDTIHPEDKLKIVVVSFNNRTVGFVVDKLLQQKEIVEKPLMRPVDKVKYIGGVTILGSGNVCLVLNVPYILHFIFNLTLQHGKGTKSLTLS